MQKNIKIFSTSQIRIFFLNIGNNKIGQKGHNVINCHNYLLKLQK